VTHYDGINALKARERWGSLLSHPVHQGPGKDSAECKSESESERERERERGIQININESTKVEVR